TEENENQEGQEKQGEQQEEQPEEQESSDSDSEGELPFEPFDINNDGRIIKTASRCSRGSWKRPEAGWDVAITVHRFCELSPPNTAQEDDGTKGDTNNEDANGLAGARHVIRQVEPDLQLELRLGEDEDDGFPEEITEHARAAGVELHPLLHCGIETMGANEHATFVVTVDGDVTDEESKGDGKSCSGGGGGGGNSNSKLPPRRRFEYDISLDDWTEEIDLSEGGDRSLLKRVTREGDGVTRPADVAGVTVRCRVLRMPIAQGGLEGEEGDGNADGGEYVVFDNLQSQDEAPASEEGLEGLEGPLSFVLDDCPFGPGVTKVLKSMTRGERCDAWLDPKYGPVDHLDDGRFYHQVILELVGVEELPPAFADDDIRLEMSSRFKLEGNEKFTAGDYARAMRRYEKAIKYADGVPPGEDSEDGDDESYPDSAQANDKEQEKNAGGDNSHNQSEAFVDLQVAVLCNQAACFLKMGDGSSAMEAAGRASSLKPVAAGSPGGIKAAYRRACALEAVGEWHEARDAFKSVLDVDPKNSQCRMGLARLVRAEKAYEASLRKTFGGCLASGKLKGFASEGREVPETPSRFGNIDEARGPSTQEDEDEPWTEGSESDTVSGDESSGGSSSSSSSSEGEKQQERVDGLYKIAVRDGGDDGGADGGVSDEDAATAEVLPGKEAAEAEPVLVPAAAATAEDAAPCSEPGTDELIPISSLSALAKEFEMVDKSSKEPAADVAVADECSKLDEAGGQADEAAANAVVPP
ncbi:unnamed protein product, partial [Hapterophycus canaliculatus]